MLNFFVFIDIGFVKQDIQKWLKTKLCSFLWRIFTFRSGVKILTLGRGYQKRPKIPTSFMDGPLPWNSCSLHRCMVDSNKTRSCCDNPIFSLFITIEARFCLNFLLLRDLKRKVNPEESFFSWYFLGLTWEIFVF